MKNVRHGVTILALAFTVGTVGACAGSRAEPDWRPRTSRGAASAPGKGKTEVKRDDRRKRRNDDNGRRRGQDRRGNEERGNNGKGKGKP
jgi:hypothetical protein